MDFRSLLVTGGAGFIGANFVHHWCRKYPQARIAVLDALTYAGNRANLAEVDAHPGLRFVHGDIRDTALVESLLRERDVDAVVHFAAESHVDRSISGPDPFLETNVQGTHSLLKAVKRCWLDARAAGRRRFHHVSTDEVYGSLGFADAPFTEDSPYRPSSPYAASKAASDHLVHAWHVTYGLDVTISNCSNNYGPYHFPEKLIPLMLINALEGRPLPVYGQGLNVRDWLHVEDHCRGIELVLTGGQGGRTYNIGGNCERSNIDLVRTLCGRIDALFGAEPELRERFSASPAASGAQSAELIRFVSDRPGHDLRYALDAGRIRAELGFAPALALEPGLERTIRWYLDNEEWWRAVMDGRYRDWIRTQYAVLHD
jgi:dTDP-glucose 4,6-dehydratase